MCRAASADACLAACQDNSECNCAVWGANSTCHMLWPFCDAAVLDFAANGTDVALQPCRESAAGKLNPVAMNSTCAQFPTLSLRTALLLFHRSGVTADLFTSVCQCFSARLWQCHWATQALTSTAQCRR